MVAFAHAEEFADDFHCQRQCVVLDHVHVTARDSVRDSAIEQYVGDLLDARSQLLDHARREGLIDEAAQASVGIAVGIEHVVCEQAVQIRLSRLLGELFAGQGVVYIFDIAAVVAQGLGYIFITCEIPHTRRAVGTDAAEDRFKLAQPGVGRIGIGLEVRPGQEGWRPRRG